MAMEKELERSMVPNHCVAKFILICNIVGPFHTVWLKCRGETNIKI